MKKELGAQVISAYKSPPIYYLSKILFITTQNKHYKANLKD